MSQKFLTSAQVRARYGGRSAMWIVRKLQNDPTFPRPVKFGGSQFNFWELSKLEEWEREQTAKSAA